MSRSRWLTATAALILATTSCTIMPPPVPVIGPAPDVAALAGTWSGDYWSPTTGRSGSITFSLAASADTAFGDVLMLPSRFPHAASDPVPHTTSDQAPRWSPARSLSIAFVRSAGDSVFGYLDPYEDPDSEGLLLTKFAGRLEGDAITGRYLTRNTRTSEITAGRWSVRRKPSSTREVHP